MIPIYKYFAKNYNLDWSDEAMFEMYDNESSGIPFKNNPWKNGYYVGKHWLDVTLSMWKRDIKEGLLFSFELYEDEFFKDYTWWLDKVL